MEEIDMDPKKDEMYPDKYRLTHKESSYLLKKNIVELVYNAGKFEGLNTTILQTEEIIKYNRANNVAVDDVLTVVNLKRGFEFLLSESQATLLEKSKQINRIVAAEDALFPGKIRTGGVEVSTMEGRYIPPMLTEEAIQKYYEELFSESISTTEKAFRLFLFISKNQLFWDGNKRTALLTANQVLFENGAGLFSIPEKEFSTFNQLLSKYYNTENLKVTEDILTFMYENCLFGIQY